MLFNSINKHYGVLHIKFLYARTYMQFEVFIFDKLQSCNQHHFELLTWMYQRFHVFRQNIEYCAVMVSHFSYNSSAEKLVFFILFVHTQQVIVYIRVLWCLLNTFCSRFVIIVENRRTAKFIQTTNCFTAKADLQVNLNKNNLKQIYIHVCQWLKIWCNIINKFLNNFWQDK